MSFEPYNPARVGGQLIDKSLGAARDADIDGNNVFEDWIFPQRKEQRQLGQQVAMMYNEPKIRMQAMKEAGINPLTAAGGIAGSSPSSTPQPTSSVNPIGDVAGAVGTAADAFNAAAGGISTLGKLSPEISNIKSDTAKNFADIGLTNEQTQGVMTDNKYKDEDWRANLDVKRQQFVNMKAEWDNLKATHEQIKKSIDVMQSQIELNGSQQDQLDALRNRIEEETRFIQAKNDFCLRNKLYLLESGIDGYIFSMIESGADMSQFDKFVDTYSNYRERVGYAEQSGISKAERLFGSSKSPWELGDKYLKRFVDWIKSNNDNPEVMREQIGQIAMQLQQEHPSWDFGDIMQEMQRMGFTADELEKALK